MLERIWPGVKILETKNLHNPNNKKLRKTETYWLNYLSRTYFLNVQEEQKLVVRWMCPNTKIL